MIYLSKNQYCWIYLYEYFSKNQKHEENNSGYVHHKFDKTIQFP